MMDFQITSKLGKKQLKSKEQLTFAVNHDLGKIILDNKGHAALAREYGIDRRDYEGGYIFLNQNKITFNSGAMSPVSRNWSGITSDISGYLGVILSTPN